MAQLRDQRTSELLATGTPLEIATCAADMTEVIFDDVGPAFDAAVLRARYDAELTGLQNALSSLPVKAVPPVTTGGLAQQKSAMQVTIQDRLDRIAAGKAMVAAATKAQAAAWDRVARRA
jgi:hypothetical protein